MNETGMWVFGEKILERERVSTPRKAHHSASPHIFTEGVQICCESLTEFVKLTRVTTLLGEGECYID